MHVELSRQCKVKETSMRCSSCFIDESLTALRTCCNGKSVSKVNTIRQHLGNVMHQRNATRTAPTLPRVMLYDPGCEIHRDAISAFCFTSRGSNQGLIQSQRIAGRTQIRRSRTVQIRARASGKRIVSAILIERFYPINVNCVLVDDGNDLFGYFHTLPPLNAPRLSAVVFSRLSQRASFIFLKRRRTVCKKKCLSTPAECLFSRQRRISKGSQSDTSFYNHRGASMCSPFIRLKFAAAGARGARESVHFSVNSSESKYRDTGFDSFAIGFRCVATQHFHFRITSAE